MNIPAPTSPSNDSRALPAESVRHNIAGRKWAKGAQRASRSNVEQGGGSSSETGKSLSRRKVRVLTEEQKKRRAALDAARYAGLSPEGKKQKSKTDYANQKTRESKFSIEQVKAKRAKARALGAAWYAERKEALKLPEELQNPAHKATRESKLAKQRARCKKVYAGLSNEEKNKYHRLILQIKK